VAAIITGLIRYPVRKFTPESVRAAELGAGAAFSGGGRACRLSLPVIIRSLGLGAPMSRPRERIDDHPGENERACPIGRPDERGVFAREVGWEGHDSAALKAWLLACRRQTSARVRTSQSAPKAIEYPTPTMASGIR